MKIIGSILFILFCNSARAGGGNDFAGGFLIKANNSYELFDFYENGIKVISIPQQDDSGSYRSEVELLGFSEAVTSGIVYKLNQIRKLSPEFSDHIYDILVGFSWIIIPQEIKRIEDVGPSPIDTTRLALVPVALRNKASKSVYLTHEFFIQLNDQNKIGLIFHEILSEYLAKSTSSNARALTAYIFSTKFERAKFMDLESFMVGLNPTIHETKRRPLYIDPYAKVYYSWKENSRGNVWTNKGYIGSGNFFTYSSAEEFNPQICQKFINQYLLKLNAAATLLSISWKKMNSIMDEIKKRERERYEPISSWGPFVEFSQSHGHDGTPNYMGRANTYPNLDVRIDYTDSTDSVTKRVSYRLPWKHYFDYSELYQVVLSFRIIHETMLVGPKRKCDFSAKDIKDGGDFWNYVKIRLD